MQSLQFSCIKQYSYQRIHATLGAEAIRLKFHICRLPGRALFNQEKSKLMQTKGQLSKSACCFFVCTIFDSFLNDLSRCFPYRTSSRLDMLFEKHGRSVLFISCFHTRFDSIDYLVPHKRLIIIPKQDMIRLWYDINEGLIIPNG